MLGKVKQKNRPTEKTRDPTATKLRGLVRLQARKTVTRTAVKSDPEKISKKKKTK